MTTIPPHPTAPGEEFFSRIRSLGIARPDHGRWAGGVAAGLAHRWGVDPLLIRGAFVALSLLGGTGLALYGLAWLFLPQPDGRIHAQEVLRGNVSAGFFGAVACVVFDVPTEAGFGWQGGPFGWHPLGGGLMVLALIALAVWLVANRNTPPGTPPAATSGGPSTGQASSQSTSPSTSQSTSLEAAYEAPAAEPRWAVEQSWPVEKAGAQLAPPRPVDVHAPSGALTRATLGAALVVAVAVLLYDRYIHSLPGFGWLAASAVALGIVAIGLVVAGLLDRRGGGLVPMAIVLAIVSINGAVFHGTIGTMGQRTWAPAAAADAHGGYELGAGEATLDLTNPALTSSATATSPLTVPVRLGAGRLRIVVPAGTPTEVHSKVGLGEIDDRIDDTRRSGGGNDLVVRSGGAPAKLIVTAELGVGSLEVTKTAEVAK